ncbi:MAG: DMT family transporter [Acidobacteriaceae bacterium]
MKPRIILALVALSVIWGSTWMAIRVLVIAVPPMHSASLRFLLASAILLPIIQWKRLPWPTGRGLHATLLLSLSMIAVPSALTFWSEQRLSSGLTALIFGAMPLMTACLTPWMAGRSVPRRAWEAMIVGLGGLGLVMFGAISTSRWQAVGAMAVLLAVSMYAASSVYAKEALAGVHPFVGTSIQFFLGGIWLALASMMFERGRTSAWSTQALVSLIFLSVFASALSFTLYYWLLQRIEAYQLTSLQLIVPVLAVAEGALLLMEPVPWTMIAGAAVVLGSIVFVMRARRGDEQEIELRLDENPPPSATK